MAENLEGRLDKLEEQNATAEAEVVFLTVNAEGKPANEKEAAKLEAARARTRAAEAAGQKSRVTIFMSRIPEPPTWNDDPDGQDCHEQTRPRPAPVSPSSFPPATSQSSARTEQRRS